MSTRFEPADFEARNGIWVESASDEHSAYRRQWETEASTDHVRSAIARSGGDTIEELTAKLTPVWTRIPRGASFGTILDIGCGYGRLELFLSHTRRVTCEIFVGVDVSETMLRHLQRYRKRFDVFPGADATLLCASAHRLPLQDDSVDLAISSAVFLHMGRTYAEAALAELDRVLRPTGHLVLESSFPNRSCPANLIGVLRNRGAERRPNQLKYYSRSELVRLLSRSGLSKRKIAVEAAERALLPKNVGLAPVPLARRVNRLAARAPSRLDSLVAMSYTVVSADL